MNVRIGLMIVVGLAASARAAERSATVPESPAVDRDSIQDVIFLSEARPYFIRLKLDAAGKGFRSAWLDSVKAIHAYLDRDGDGTLTRAEADQGALPAMVRAATGGGAALPRADLDTNPKDGKVSLEELADVLQPALGPFRVQVGRVAVERADALFNHLDRDKDGTLTKEELSAAVASLRRFDLDDDELIDATELEPFSNPIAMQYENDPMRRGRYATVPPVIDLSPDDASIRPVRLLLKRYDTGKGKGATAADNRLTPGEFAIEAKDFAAADSDSDGMLDAEELRRWIGRVVPDVELTVTLPADGATPASIAVAGTGSKPLPPGVKVQKLAGLDVEVSINDVALEFHADGGEHALDNAKSYYANQFQAADANNDKYLEKSETKDHGPFAALFDLMDRDGDGKLYMKEVDAFVEKQSQAARSQMVLAASDQGRAIFAIMDKDRDRKLGAREVRGAVARVSSWDRNGDGKVGSDEVPHRYQLTIGRGQIAAVGALVRISAGMMAAPENVTPAAGPAWFRRMDRNHDGDLSRREFLGNRVEFNRLDRDGDGLIDADEAAQPVETAKRP